MATAQTPPHMQPSSDPACDTPQRKPSMYRSLWTFAGKPVHEIMGKTWTNLLQDDLTGRAAQLAYYFFLSLFPALIFASSLIGLIAGTQSHLRDHLMDSFATFLPPSAFLLVSNTFSEVIKASSTGKIALGIVFALWSATSGMSAAQDTLNGIYRVKETRPFWKSTLIAIALTIVVVSLALLALAVFFYGGTLVTLTAEQLGLNSVVTLLWRLVQWPTAMFLLSLVFAVTYFYAPDVKQKKWKWMTPGSVVGIAGWFAASGIFRAYLHFFNHYSVTYGSLGAFIILLLWFYLSALMLLIGAEVDATIERSDAENCKLPPTPIAVEAPVSA